MLVFLFLKEECDRRKKGVIFQIFVGSAQNLTSWSFKKKLELIKTVKRNYSKLALD